MAHPSVGLKKKWAAERIALEAAGLSEDVCSGRSARSRALAHLFDRRTELGDEGADCKPKEHAMTAPNATLTNGRYELPPQARGVLVLADPPEAGWRLRPSASEPASADRRAFAARAGSGGPARAVHPPERSE